MRQKNILESRRRSADVSTFKTSPKERRSLRTNLPVARKALAYSLCPRDECVAGNNCDVSLSMKITLENDRENDLVYLSFGARSHGKGSVAKTVRISEDIFVDLDSDERLLGLEVINASKRLEGDRSGVEADMLVG